MGRERTRQGKLVYLCVACIASLLVTGCSLIEWARKDEAPPEQRQEQRQEQPQDHGKAEAEKKAKEKQDEREQRREPERREPVKQPVPVPPGTIPLLAAKRLLAQGDLEGSLRESQKSLFQAGKAAPGDEALFTMGLIFVHYKSPQRDYKQSADAFRRLLKEYPLSPLAEQAKIWLGVLQVIERSKQVDLEIDEMKKELNR